MRFLIKFLALATAMFWLFGIVPISTAATVTYTMQTGNFNSRLVEKNNNPGYAGFFNSTATEIGLFSNGGSFNNTPGAAAFETFTTTGNGNTGAVRALQVGDTFTITGFTPANPSGGGYLGISFRDSTTYSNFFSATDNTTEARFQLDNTGGWKVYNAGTAVDSGLGSNSDRTFTIKITSANTFNATVGSTTYYDLSMAAGGGTIDSFAIYTYGDSNQNSYWKNASLSDTGTVELGNDLASGSRTISGIISDGLNADSTSTVRANAVTVSGSSGSWVVLSAANTYTGQTTVNANASLEVQNAASLGSVNGITVVNSGGTLRLWNGGTGFTTAAEALTLNGAGVSSGGALRNVLGNNTYAGAITLASGSRINSDAGTLTLDVANGNAITGPYQLNIGGAGNVTVNDNINISTAKLVKDGAGTLTLNAVMNYTGNTEIDQGTVAIGSGGGLASGSAVFIGSGANNLDSTLSLAGTTTFANNLVVNPSTGSGTRTITKSDATSQAMSGAITLNRSTSFDVVSGGTLALSGVVSGNEAFTKTGDGIMVLSGGSANTFSAGTVTVSAGTLVLNKSANTSAIAGRPISISSGATLRTDAAGQIGSAPLVTANGTFDLNGNNQTVALAGGGAVKLNGTSASGTLTINNSGTDTFSGTITDNARTDGSVTKIGVGTQILSGNNSYDGLTTVSVGVLRIGHANALGSTTGATTVSTGAALELSSNIAVGTESLTLNGDGISSGGSLRNVNGDNSWAGLITLGSSSRINANTTGGSGSLTIGGNISGGSNVLFLGAQGTSGANTGGNITVSGAISGAGATQDATVTTL